MATPTELDRIAAAMHALRPDWRTTSLVTFLTEHHADRPYRDLAIAATAVATDPKTTTPRLLNEHGAWWAAAQTVQAATTAPDAIPRRTDDRCTEPGHEHELARACRICLSEQKAGDHDTPTDRAMRAVGVPRDRVRAILAAAHAPTTPDARTRAGGTR